MFINTIKPKLRSYVVNLLYEIKNLLPKTETLVGHYKYKEKMN